MGLKYGLLAAATAALMSGPALADDIPLGMVVATSGAFAGGEAPLINGVQMAVDDINEKGGIDGDMLVLSIEDTGSEQTGAINAFNRAVSYEPVAIMNTTLSGFNLSLMPIIEEEGIPTFTGGASVQLSPEKRGARNLFRVRTSDAAVPVAAAKFAIETLGAKSLGVVYINNDYGIGWRDEITAVAEAAGVELAAESFEGADRDLTPQIVSMRDAGADVVISVGDPPNQVVFVQQAGQLGLDAEIIVSNAGVLPTTLTVYPEGAADGIYGTVDSLPAIDPATADWAERYTERFGITADYSAAEYYDGVMMLADAIAEVGTDPEDLVDYLREIDGYDGIGNTYSYVEGGDGGTGVVLGKVEGTKLTLAAQE